MFLLKKQVIFFLLIVFLFTPFFSANAQISLGNCSGTLSQCIINNTIKAGSSLGNPDIDLPTFIGNLIKFALTLVGTIFIVLIIYAGFLWMTAGGNSDQVKKAASTMRNSAIGLVIILLSYAITVTVFDILLKASTNFP